MRKLAFAAFFLVLLAIPGTAQDFDAGRSAYDIGDYDRTLNELRPLALNGNAEAQFLLAMIYGNGFGVPKDRRHAAYWYRLAAEQGHPVAQLHLGFYYRRGYGVPEDRVFSHMWTSLAAELGNNEAPEWREKVEVEMSIDEVSEARERAADWLKRREKLY